jgi:hypothetical protein
MCLYFKFIVFDDVIFISLLSQRAAEEIALTRSSEFELLRTFSLLERALALKRMGGLKSTLTTEASEKGKNIFSPLHILLHIIISFSFSREQIRKMT